MKCFMMLKNVNYTTSSGMKGCKAPALVDLGDLKTFFPLLATCSMIFLAAPGGEKKAVRFAGRDLRYDLEIEFMDAAKGKEVELAIPREENCETCQGSGSETGRRETCASCNGQGQIYQSRGFIRLATTCPRCRGEGTMVSDPCEDCRGTGRVQKEKKVSVRIPAGVDTGSRLRLRNEGEAGRLSGPPGDLYVVLHVREHEFFQREGDHVVCRIPVSMIDATLGAEIEVPTLDGDRKLKIPKGINTGELLRFRGEGFPNVRGYGHGDQVMEVQVLTPTHLTKRQEELLREFASIDQEKREKKSWTERATEKIKEALG